MYNIQIRNKNNKIKYNEDLYKNEKNICLKNYKYLCSEYNEQMLELFNKELYKIQYDIRFENKSMKKTENESFFDNICVQNNINNQKFSSSSHLTNLKENYIKTQQNPNRTIISNYSNLKDNNTKNNFHHTLSSIEQLKKHMNTSKLTPTPPNSTNNNHDNEYNNN